MHITRLLTGALIAVTIHVSISRAGAFEDGEAAFERGDYATALPLLRPLAEQGNAKAEAMIGDVYQYLSEYAEAIKWYNKSGRAG
jgi:hypothetical protein